MIPVIYNIPGFLMIVAGAIAGLVTSGAGLSSSGVGIASGIVAGVVDFLFRVRRAGQVSTDYGVMLDPRCGGMLYYCPIWILGWCVSAIILCITLLR
jgi:hypothetical protein